MILQTVCVGMMQVNCYILAEAEGGDAIIIDPGSDERKIKRALEKYRLRPCLVVNTHGHYDHIGCDDKFGVPIYVHSKDLPLLKDPGLNLSGIFAVPYNVGSQIITVEDGSRISSGGIELQVRHIPGHTPGGIALILKKPEAKAVFTGDSLFCQGIGRTDLAGGSEDSLIEAIKQKLISLPDDTVIYPGHGPSSTIGREKSNFR